MNCINSGQCSVEDHELKYIKDYPSFCGDAFSFKAYRPGSTLFTILKESALSSQLRFVGYPQNDILNFFVGRDGTISVDPTWGLNESSGSTSGSCLAACTKISANSLQDTCCSCSGTKTFKRSAWNAVTYVCQ